MFNHNHYVPVLRWKRGEWLALKSLNAADRSWITPLIEIPPKHWGLGEAPTGPVADGSITQTAIQIAENWGNDPAFLDLGLIRPSVRASSGKSLLDPLSEHARHLQLPLVPVATISRPQDYAAVSLAAQRCGAGAAIRLTRQDLLDTGLRIKIMEAAAAIRLPKGELDLIIDLKLVGDTCPSIATICASIPDLLLWRTFTLIAGSFPKDLTSFSVGEHLLERTEWNLWNGQVNGAKGLARRPAFGDYCTQHANFTEPPSFANFSASIRYATATHWVIMRGEGVRNDDGPGYSQWPANAQMLCARGEFLGQDFSAGDAYIHETSLQTKKTGNAETWLRAGINHHLTVVARQVASLSVDEAHRTQRSAASPVALPRPGANR